MIKLNSLIQLKIFLILALGFLFSHCASSVVLKTKSTRSRIDQVNLLAVHYRRPEFSVAEQGYLLKEDQPVDCLSPAELWKDLKDHSAEVMECLNSLQDEVATYFYVSDLNPRLELDENGQKVPDCLKKTLSKIPLPREIYYLADQQDSEFHSEFQGCYSSSFSTRTNHLLKTPTSWLKKRIQLPLSSDRKLNQSNDLLVWLMVTTFNLLKSDDQVKGNLWGAPVPDLVCKACFKNDALFEDKFHGKIKPVFWP
jgi:hypothetical protein